MIISINNWETTHPIGMAITIENSPIKNSCKRPKKQQAPYQKYLKSAAACFAVIEIFHQLMSQKINQISKSLELNTLKKPPLEKAWSKVLILIYTFAICMWFTYLPLKKQGEY